MCRASTRESCDVVDWASIMSRFQWVSRDWGKPRWAGETKISSFGESGSIGDPGFGGQDDVHLSLTVQCWCWLCFAASM